jgi:hypothetical protein
VSYIVVNWCKGDQCDPCKPKETNLYVALIPKLCYAGYGTSEVIIGTRGDPPPVPGPPTPGAAPGFIGKYGNGSVAASIPVGAPVNGWQNLGSGETFTPTGPYDPIHPGAQAGYWTVTTGAYAYVPVLGLPTPWTPSDFVMIAVDGEIIKALGQAHISPAFYTEPHIDPTWYVGYSYDVPHIMVIPIPAS